MGSNLKAVLRVQFLNKSGWNAYRYEQDTKKKNRALALLLVVVMVGFIMAGYCFGIGYGLGYMGLAKVVPGYALTITALVTLFFTFFKTNGYLFAFKDYDLLMALPVDPKTIITAKFLYMYLSNLVFALIVMGPMAVGYGFWQTLTLGRILLWLVGILIVPLFPMTIAALLGVIITAIGAGFKHKVLVQVILSILLIVGIFGGTFWMQGAAMENEKQFLMQLKNLGAVLSEKIHGLYPLSAWFDQAVNHGNILDMVWFVGFSLVWYGCFVLLSGKYYGTINTKLMTFHAKANYKVGTLKTNGIHLALVGKEFKRFFSSTIYVTNSGMGLIMALFISIASIIFGIDQVLKSMGIPNTPSLQQGIRYAVPFAVAMIVNMTCTTSVTLSLEGRNLWVVQSLPISPKILFQGKMLFNLILVLPVSLLCNLIFGIELKVGVLLALLYLFISVVTVLFSTAFGMWINIQFPNYKWENEVEVIKQGMASAFGIFSDMIGYLLLAVGTFLLSFKVPGEFVLAVFGLLLGSAAWFFYARCCKANIPM